MFTCHFVISSDISSVVSIFLIVCLDSLCQSFRQLVNNHFVCLLCKWKCDSSVIKMLAWLPGSVAYQGSLKKINWDSQHIAAKIWFKKKVVKVLGSKVSQNYINTSPAKCWLVKNNTRLAPCTWEHNWLAQLPSTQVCLNQVMGSASSRLKKWSWHELPGQPRLKWVPGNSPGKVNTASAILTMLLTYLSAHD